MKNNNNSSGGIGFLGLLFITFLVLKLTHVIGWSWWFVTMPLWLLPAFLAIASLMVIIFGGIPGIVKKIVFRLRD